MGSVRVSAHYLRLATCILLLPVLLDPLALQGQSVQTPAGTATVQGFVRDSSGHPVTGAAVCLQAKDALPITARTDSAGGYSFPTIHPGMYSLRAEMPGYTAATFSPIVLRDKESRTIDLTL